MKTSADASSDPAGMDITPHKGSVFERPLSETPDKEDKYDIPANERLHRILKPRHVTMIAIGGAIGTGLIIGSGAALVKTGPASTLITYAVVGFMVYMMLGALGEMATWLPMGSGFTGYATRFVDPALGFALGWMYWMKFSITAPNQLTTAALIIQYWCPATKVNPGVFITVFMVAFVAINYLGPRVFGETEFWLSTTKITILVALIILCLVLVAGGGPNHARAGFEYWTHPGAFAPFIKTGAAGRFLGLWLSWNYAILSYLGIELVGVTVGEAQNPRRAIPKAIKLSFFRIIFFYIVLIFLLGMLVPYDSPLLVFASKASTSAAASPFVVAIKLAGIDALPGIFNGCLLVFILSAGTSDLYVATRSLYGLATERNAPRIFTRTNSRGVPVYALAASSAFLLLAFMNVSTASRTVFTYFVNLMTTFGMLCWISILVSHIYFVRARRAQGVLDSDLHFKAPFGIYGSYVALAFFSLMVLTKNFNTFVHSSVAGGSYGSFDYKDFITGYLGLPIYLILIVGAKLIRRSKGVHPKTADLFGGKQAIDDEEAEYLVQQEVLRRSRDNHKYRNLYRFVEWLF